VNLRFAFYKNQLDEKLATLQKELQELLHPSSSTGEGENSPDEDKNKHEDSEKASKDTPSFRQALSIGDMIKVTLDNTAYVEDLATASLNSQISETISLQSRVDNAARVLENQKLDTAQKDSADISLQSWSCPKCQTINSMIINHCTYCQAERPNQVMTKVQSRSWSDRLAWSCPKCGSSNHLSLTSCPVCSTKRPDFSQPSVNQIKMAAAEKTKWHCPKCGVLNENTIESCPFCSTSKPKISFL